MEVAPVFFRVTRVRRLCFPPPGRGTGHNLPVYGPFPLAGALDYPVVFGVVWTLRYRRRVARVVESGGLEIRCTVLLYRGFESLTLR